MLSYTVEPLISSA